MFRFPQAVYSGLPPIPCQEPAAHAIKCLATATESSRWRGTKRIRTARPDKKRLVIQSNLNLFANEVLPLITVVVLLQTKIIWMALYCYLFWGQGQSKMQIVALGLVVLATLWLRKILPLCCLKHSCHNGDETSDTIEATEAEDSGYD